MRNLKAEGWDQFQLFRAQEYQNFQDVTATQTPENLHKKFLYVYFLFPLVQATKQLFRVT